MFPGIIGQRITGITMLASSYYPETYAEDGALLELEDGRILAFSAADTPQWIRFWVIDDKTFDLTLGDKKIRALGSDMST
jgi:hypothetical protein